MLSRSDVVKTLNVVNNCPHCGISSPFLPIEWSGVTTGSNRSGPRLWGAFSCNSCGGIVTAVSNIIGSDDYLLNLPTEIFPAPRAASADIPATARRYLQQALDTIHSPDAAAVMAGSAVDAMLKSSGLNDGSLYSRIDLARDQGILTQGMADWAHEIRLGSNRPRHADVGDPHVTPEQARQSVDFAEALGNFLFVLTARIQRGIEAAKADDTPT